MFCWETHTLNTTYRFIVLGTELFFGNYLSGPLDSCFHGYRMNPGPRQQLIQLRFEDQVVETQQNLQTAVPRRYAGGRQKGVSQLGTSTGSFQEVGLEKSLSWFIQLLPD